MERALVSSDLCFSHINQQKTENWRIGHNFFPAVTFLAFSNNLYYKYSLENAEKPKKGQKKPKKAKKEQKI